MNNKINIFFPDDFEINVSDIKSMLRQKFVESDQIIFVKAGMGVITTSKAKLYLQRVGSLMKDRKFVVITESLPTRLQADYLCRRCKCLRIRVLHPDHKETKFWLNQ